jgi:hypothetical protein
MKIKKVLFNVFASRLEPKILHHTPGRVRIHLPILKKIPGEFHQDTEELLSMTSLIREIDNTSVSFITGNILIHYNHQQVSAEDILKAFIFLNQLVIRNREQIISNPGQEILELKKKLPAILPKINLKTFDIKEIEANAL